MAKIMHEYAFDVKLFAVIRVQATSTEDAKKTAQQAIDCVDLSKCVLNNTATKITEATLSTDDEERFDPFEIDGEETD